MRAMKPGDSDLLGANIGTDRDPHTGYAKQRAKHTVHAMNHLGADVVMVYSYDAAEVVLKEQERFSARINGRWMGPLLGRTILEMDGREHFVHRKLIAHAFRPTVVKSWTEDLILPTIHEVIDGFAGRGEAELVREFTWEVPVRVFAKVLGVPSVDHGRWQRWAIDMERAALDYKRALATRAEVEQYFQTVIDERRAEPQDDLISDLVSAELDGERLPDDIIHGFIRLLIPAGAATTYRLLGSLALAVLGDEDRVEQVRADPTLIPRAVEETLRWESPVQFAAREATIATELEGVEIPADMPVIVALGAANRDQMRYDEPDEFNVERQGPPPHIAFGDGVHRCLGEHLARLEATVAFQVLLERLPKIRLEAGDMDPHVFGYAFRSPNCVPVRF